MKKDCMEHMAAFPGGTIEELLPTKKLMKDPLDPDIAYRLVLDELLDEGVARQNLATFCQTYMEPEATRLMSLTLPQAIKFAGKNSVYTGTLNCAGCR